MSYLRYLCLLAHSSVKHILCCVFALLCVVYLSSLFIYILGLVYPMLPVSLDFLFLLAPSVFSNVYFHPVSCVPYVSLDCPLFCPFDIL